MKAMMDCKEFGKELPDLVLAPEARPSAAAVAHLRECPPCAEEFVAYQKMFGLLDGWKAPELSPYFDQKVAVRVREEQAAPAMGWLERLTTRMSLNTGRNFRPIMAGTLAAVLLAGAGGFTGLAGKLHPAEQPQASATVNDLQILDKNEQALQQLDELQQDDDTASGADVQLPSS